MIAKITMQVFKIVISEININIPTFGSPFTLFYNLIHRSFMDEKVSDF